MEEFAGFSGLGHAVHEVDAGHVAGGGVVNIAARLIGLGFEGKLQKVGEALPLMCAEIASPPAAAHNDIGKQVDLDDCNRAF